MSEREKERDRENIYPSAALLPMPVTAQVVRMNSRPRTSGLPCPGLHDVTCEYSSCVLLLLSGCALQEVASEEGMDSVPGA